MRTHIMEAGDTVITKRTTRRGKPIQTQIEEIDVTPNDEMNLSATEATQPTDPLGQGDRAEGFTTSFTLPHPFRDHDRRPEMTDNPASINKLEQLFSGFKKDITCALSNSMQEMVQANIQGMQTVLQEVTRVQSKQVTRNNSYHFQ